MNIYVFMLSFTTKKLYLSMQMVKRIKLRAWWFVEASIFGVKWTKRNIETKGYLYQHSWKPVVHRPRDLCVCSCICVFECMHMQACVCLPGPTSCLKKNHSKDSKAIDMQIGHTNTWLSVHPQILKKELWDALGAFRGKLSSDRPHLSGVSVRYTLQNWIVLAIATNCVSILLSSKSFEFVCLFFSFPCRKWKVAFWHLCV